MRTILRYFTTLLHSQIIHDQETSHHLQQMKELEIRLLKERDEALSKVLILEQKLVEHDASHAKLDNKLLVAYNEVCLLCVKNKSRDKREDEC